LDKALPSHLSLEHGPVYASIHFHLESKFKIHEKSIQRDEKAKNDSDCPCFVFLVFNAFVCIFSRDIVNQAIKTNAIIVLGDIKHLRRRKQNTGGRKFNRKLAGFQYYKLTQYITYKAALAGIKVIQVSEARTSQYCRKCYQKGARKIQGLFTCAKCGEENADRNAAFNIAYRALGYISKVGVTVNMPKLKLRTFASVDRNAMMTKEATYFNS
jgi:IS605 OrfB family transposase